MAVEVTPKALIFDTYVERLLTPALEPGQVVMHNLGVHRPKRVRGLIEGRGCELVYSRVYSPDLNPKEEALSKIMHLLRRIGTRTKEALDDAMGRALGAVSARDALGYFAHRGYCVPVQQL